MSSTALNQQWQDAADLNKQPQVWCYSFDPAEEALPEGKSVFMVCRGSQWSTLPVIGDTVSVERPAIKNGVAPFSVGVFKSQLTEGKALTQDGQAYSTLWSVHANNAFALARWALTGNHDRNQDQPKYNQPPKIYLATGQSTQDTAKDSVGNLPANLRTRSADDGFHQRLAR